MIVKYTESEEISIPDYIEIGSGAVLSNLAKRSCPSFNRRPVNDKTSVESFLSHLDNEDFND